jgi:hypothetical protein
MYHNQDNNYHLTDEDANRYRRAGYSSVLFYQKYVLAFKSHVSCRFPVTKDLVMMYTKLLQENGNKSVVVINL